MKKKQREACIKKKKERLVCVVVCIVSKRRDCVCVCGVFGCSIAIEWVGWIK